PDSASLCPVLQRSENAPLVGQRCAILAPGAASEASRHSHSSADCITTTCESEFSVHTGIVRAIRGRKGDAFSNCTIRSRRSRPQGLAANARLLDTDIGERATDRRL